MKRICGNVAYTKRFEIDYQPELNYIIFWKSYLKTKCSWKPILVVKYLQKLINLFYGK